LLLLLLLVEVKTLLLLPLGRAAPVPQNLLLPVLATPVCPLLLPLLLLLLPLLLIALGMTLRPQVLKLLLLPAASIHKLACSAHAVTVQMWLGKSPEEDGATPLGAS
jgi:hypothetical protein